MKKRVVVTVGCRPDCIKMMPLYNELKRRDNIDAILFSTGQHKHMLNQVFDFFNSWPDYDLSIMKDKQNLFDITINILHNACDVLREINPDLVLVHGDTSTAFAVSLACYYLQIPVGHVEAGLRTQDIYSPFPEEFNREAIGLIAKYNFAPTNHSKNNLLLENKNPKSIYVTGNTIIDAMKYTISSDYSHPELCWASGSRLIFITAHRRENIGEPMHNMFRAIRRVLIEHPDVKAIYPIHLNPSVREIANEEFSGCNQIHLIEPIGVFDCHNFEAKSYIILTDSGGIQEEAPSFGVPVLVMRNTTERPEGVEAGTLKLVGNEEESIYNAFSLLLDDTDEYQKMSKACNPYGDGQASRRIVDIIEGKEINEWNR